MKNLVNESKYQKIWQDLETKLKSLLDKTNDKFLPDMDYVKKWGYVLDETGSAPHNKVNFQGLPIDADSKNND
ncbi:MAG: hypothetical protein GZ091_08180 [Paludibacter sp.]|nr:hypothetical protein [Paludibacter sp.]